MKFLHVQVARDGREASTEFNLAQIADLPRILKTIETGKEGQTKYWVLVLLCTFLKLLSRRQDFQDWYFMWFTWNWSFTLQQRIGADANHSELKFRIKTLFQSTLIINLQVRLLFCVTVALWNGMPAYGWWAIRSSSGCVCVWNHIPTFLVRAYVLTEGSYNVCCEDSLIVCAPWVLQCTDIEVERERERGERRAVRKDRRR